MRRAIAGFFLGINACASAAASAQQRDTARTDSTKHVTPVRRLDPVVVTNSRATGIDRRVPAQLDDIKLDAVAAGPAAAAEVLRRLPGVNLFDDQGSRLQPELDLRGFTVSPVVGQPQGVSVFLDGVRINEPDAQEVNFDLIPMDAVNRAQLVRGPSAIFGKNSLASSLLLFTDRGAAGGQMSVDADGGPYGYRSALVKTGGMIGALDGMVTARVSDEQGWRDATGARTRMVFANVGRKADSSDVALTVMYANDKLFEAGSLPESYLDVDRRINYTPGDFFQPEMLHLALRGQRNIAGGQISGNLFARRNDYEQYNGNIPPPNSDGFVRNRSAGGLAEWTRLVAIGNVSTTLTFGGEYSRANVGYRFLAVDSPGVPAEPDDLATLGCAAPSRLCTDVKTNEDNAALYAETSAAFTPSLTLTAALRGDYVRTVIADRIAPDNGGTSTHWRALPKLGLTYTPTDATRAYLAVSTGFRAPAALELSCADATAPCSLPFALGADPPLQPVKVLDYEAGVDLTPTRKTRMGFAAFVSQVDDDILFVQPTATSGFFQNVPHTRRAGVDVSGSLGLPGGLRTYGSYSWVAATYQSTLHLASALDDEPPATPGDHFPTSPVQRAMAGLEFIRGIARGVLIAAVEVRGVTGQYLRGDEANVQPQLPGYAITDLHARGRLAHGTVRVAVTNLFDRQYVSFGVYARNTKGPISGPVLANPDAAPVERFLTPGQPRRLTLSVSLDR